MSLQFDKDGFATVAGEIRVFYYDPSTGEYSGWSDEYINIGVSMPGNSTDLDPGDDVAGKVWVFNGTSWVQKGDHRGETVYSTDNQRPISVDYVGAIRDGFTAIKPLTSFDKWDGSKWVTDTEAQQAARIAEVTNQKTMLMAEATTMIAPLQDAKDGGYIDEEDIPVLTAWQKYRYALTKVDAAKPVWPERPA
ncbi:tail fiber assembly protein [Escherichia coli]|nr:tail fiber assembly protein [Escherichia coli]